MHCLRPRVTLIVALIAGVAQAQPTPVADPVPPVERGEIVIGVKTIAEFPALPDAPDAIEAVESHARIQNLVPAADGSDALFVNDLRGVLYRIDRAAGESKPTPYLDLRAANVGFTNVFNGMAAGFNGFAFHPDFASERRPGYGKLYTLFSAPSGGGRRDYADDGNENHEAVLMEWTTREPRAATFVQAKDSPPREVLRVGQPGRAHTAGTIAFNPTVRAGDADYGMLYISFGDGKDQHDPLRAGQRRHDPHGGLLRINPLAGPNGERHTIPADNPFVNEPGAAPIVWIYGMRHPQHFSWDLGGTHRMFVIDMGQDRVEEINIGMPGGNYGWPTFEGTFATGMSVNAKLGPVYARQPASVGSCLDPVAQYDHDDGKVISSVVVYRGRAIPELFGKVICGDVVSGRLFYVDERELEQGRQTPLKTLRLKIDGLERELREVPNLKTKENRVDLRLGLDRHGELYLLTKSDGKVRQVVPAQ